jgi:SAM-dependent methyltransferase
MALTISDVARVCCPDCRGGLLWDGEMEGGAIHRGRLQCGVCRTDWLVEDGLARLYREERVRGSDRLLRRIYDALPSLHDPLTTALTPYLADITEEQGREHVMARMDLASLAPPEGGRPPRILEVGIGGGANLAYFRRHLGGRRAEIWGIDLSLGMLGECRKLVARQGYQGVRLLLGDGHALPFPDGSFDRVLNIGGLGGFRDPRAALAEMARVATRGSPIVVLDEQLDRGRDHGLFYRAAFRALTFYAPDPRSPRALLPEGAAGVIDEQPGRCYYCLTFHVPA